MECSSAITLWGQIQTRLQYSWPLPLIWMLAVVALLVITVWLVFRNQNLPLQQRLLLVALRIAAMLVLVGMLPGWTSYEEQTGKSDLIVLMDISGSMQFEDDFRLKDLTNVSRQWLLERYGKAFDERISKGGDTVSLPRIWLAKAFLGNSGSNSETAVDLPSGALAGAEQEYDLHVYEIGESVPQRRQNQSAADSLTDMQPAEGSALGRGVVEVLQRHRGKSVAAIVYLTDGRSNIGVSLKRAGEIARKLSVPIIVPGLIGSSETESIQLLNPSGPTRVQVDQPTSFEIDVSRHGDVSQTAVFPFRIVSEDGEREVEVSFAEGEDQATLSIQHSVANVGEQVLRVEYVSSEILGRDEQRRNRHLEQHEFHFLAVDDAINVLLIEQFPRFEFRTLEDLLSRATNNSGQSRFQVTTVLGTADPQLAQEDDRLYTSVLEDRDWLFAFDVIVVGDVPTDLLTFDAQSILVDFVQQRGGGMVFIAGDRFLPEQFNDQPLAELFPAEVDSYESQLQKNQPASLQLSQLGERTALTSLTETSEANRAVWKTLPGPYWLVQSLLLQSGVQVLVYADSETEVRVPLVTQQFAGAGRVIFQAFDSTWRWKQQTNLKNGYALYWTQLINYLAGAGAGNGRTGVALSVSTEEVAFGESVEVKVRFLNPVAAPEEERVVVELSEETGKAEIVRLTRSGISQGVFTASLSDLRVGQYTLRLVSPVGMTSTPATLRMEVRNQPKEQLITSGDVKALRDLAATSGGEFYELSQWDMIQKELPHGQRMVIQELNRRLLWNTNWMVSIFVLSLSIEWGLRRRWYN
jgi:hypothetical protein